MSQSFAMKMNQLRRIKGLTLENLSLKANVSKSMISKIERNEVRPTLDIALRLTNALGVMLADVIQPAEEQILLVRKKDQREVRDVVNAIQYTHVMDTTAHNPFSFECLTIPSGSNTGNLSKKQTKGNKLLYVSDGKVTLLYNQSHYELTAGDAISFNNSFEHEIINTTPDSACVHIISVNTHINISSLN